MPPPVFRFAPSPNGYLHLGHAYSALLNFDLARRAGGRFLLRIEDIDATRCRPEFEAAIHEDLAWLGISWETPVRRQSQHFARYREAVERLAGLGLIYLAVAVNLTTSLLGAFTLLSYLFVYTPLKRVTWLNTAIGAVPGALANAIYNACGVRIREHPITRGMPREWLHVNDELYDKLRGPGQNMHVLATTFSDPAKGGTGRHEPMILTIDYGKGRVFHTPMGHDLEAMRCVGFITTLQRGTEWAATGEVTIPIPANFPTAGQTSSIPMK